jgi:hypothetical protein
VWIVRGGLERIILGLRGLGARAGRFLGLVLLTLKASNNIKLLDYQFTDYAQTFHIYAFFFRVDTQERQPYSRLSFQHNYPDQIKPT